jgi:hypothetical protein
MDPFTGPYIASLLGGTVSGMIVGDSLGAVPTKTTVPATGSGGAAIPAKSTANGTPVNPTQTPRQLLHFAAAYVVGAILVLLLGSRALRNARIG